MSQQISGTVSPLISAQCGLQNTSAPVQHTRAYHTAKHSCRCTSNPTRKSKHTYDRCMPRTQKPGLLACAHTHTHLLLNAQQFCTWPQTFPHVEANSLGIDSIPLCFYSGKICPLTQSISNIEESSSQGMPCFTAKRVRQEMDQCPLFIYVVFLIKGCCARCSKRTMDAVRIHCVKAALLHWQSICT